MLEELAKTYSVREYDEVEVGVLVAGLGEGLTGREKEAMVRTRVEDASEYLSESQRLSAERGVATGLVRIGPSCVNL